MKILLTGASGFIGSAVVRELLSHKHEVYGLSRSEKSSEVIKSLGAIPVNGNLENLSSIKKACEGMDGIIHLGFNHDFSKFKENCEMDARVIDTFSECLSGSGKPLVVTSGINLLEGKLLTEDLEPREDHGHFRSLTEKACKRALLNDVDVRIVRLAPSVHGKGDDGYMFGFVSILVAVAKDKKVAAFIEGGENAWSAIHREDAAILFTLALLKGKKGAKYHGVGESSITMRDIASKIGELLKVDVKNLSVNEGQEFFGWLSSFVSQDSPASSEMTQKELGWKPTNLGLLRDLEEGIHLQKNTY